MKSLQNLQRHNADVAYRVLWGSGAAAVQEQHLPHIDIGQGSCRVLHPEATQAHGSGRQQLRRAL